MFSTVIKHSLSLEERATVVLLQYIGGLAVVQGVKTYGPGYEKLPIKLKWPNDICKTNFSASNKKHAL